MNSTGAARADLLATIIAGTKRTLEIREAREPLAALTRRAEATPVRPRAFEAALRHAGRPNVIAECKRRSPSKGVLRADYDPVAIARSYEAAGAVALSVLTEPSFFDGSLGHLQAVRAAVEVPLLRKDFVIAEYQLFEARAAGADAVLLIVAAMTPERLRGLRARAEDLGLDALVEVHTAEELSVALGEGARIVGVNNRNLRTLEVDVRASEALIARVPADVVAVSESGLKTADDLVRLSRLGYRAFLIGERFMSDPHPGDALRRLLTDIDVALASADRSGSPSRG